jgi:hypothetical protein
MAYSLLYPFAHQGLGDLSLDLHLTALVDTFPAISSWSHRHAAFDLSKQTLGSTMGLRAARERPRSRFLSAPAQGTLTRTRTRSACPLPRIRVQSRAGIPVQLTLMRFMPMATLLRRKPGTTRNPSASLCEHLHRSPPERRLGRGVAECACRHSVRLYPAC